MASSAAAFPVEIPAPKLFLDGCWVEGDSKETLEVRSPATGEILARFPHASARDVDRAVEAGRKAWKRWRRTKVRPNPRRNAAGQ